MILFKYPVSETTDDWLRKFNTMVETNQYGVGTFGLALDVWRDGMQLFSSYLPEHGETHDEWCRRNHPEISNPEHNRTAMGANVPAMDRFLVPTRAAFTVPMSLNTIRTVIMAAIATAQHPQLPSMKPAVPKDNAMRQRLYNADQDWMNLKLYDHENDIAVRAVIGRIDDHMFRDQRSKYHAVLWERPDSNLKGALDPTDHEFVADTCAMDDVKARKHVLKEAKRLFFLTGQNGRVIADDHTAFTYRCGNLPYDFKVERTHDFAIPEVPTDKRTLDL